MIEVIPEPLAGERLDRVVAMFLSVSRAVSAQAITDGHVRLDGEVVTKVSHRCDTGQELSVDDSVLEPDDGVVPDPDVAVELVHVDDEVIVVDKSPGQVVHPGSGNRSGTIAHGIVARFPEVADVGQPDRPGIVHRLDKGTSGVFMIARTPQAHESLTDQLRDRTVDRTYLTFGWGEPATDRGIIDAPIGRAVRDPTRMVVRDDGKVARTHYEVLARWDDPSVTLFACTLDTGRTHQIRVHLEAIGHPVVGDPRYGGGRDRLGMERPALHAARLGFTHPGSGERLEFSVRLPEDMASLADRLGPPTTGAVPR